MQDLYRLAVSEAFSNGKAKIIEARRDVTREFSKYVGREVDFCRDVLGDRFWAAETELIESLFSLRYVSARGCRKWGKTHTGSRAVLAAMCTEPTICVTTAPTTRTVKEVMWSKIRDAHANSLVTLPGVCDTMQYRLGPQHFAIGASTNSPARFKGFHSGVEPPEDPDADEDEMLHTERGLQQIEKAVEKTKRQGTRLFLLFDEANGVPQFIYDALQGSMAADNVLVLMLANPLMSVFEDHEFARSHRTKGRYHRIKVGAMPSDDPVKADSVYTSVPNWLQPESWIEHMRASCGDDPEENPVWQADVLGNFVSGTARWRVVPSRLLEANASGTVRGHEMLEGRHIGIDPGASEDGDPSVASLLVDGVKRAEYEWRERDTMATVDIIRALAKKWGEGGKPVPGYCIHGDVIGIGHGAMDRLRQLGVEIDAVDFASKPSGEWSWLTGETQFANRRAELHWVFRRLLEENYLSVPEKWSASWEQATWAEYEYIDRSIGRVLRILPKDDLKARYGRSPDVHDSVLYALSRGSSSRPTFSVVGRW